MEITGDCVDSDSDQQPHHVRVNMRPTRRRLSSAMVKPAGNLTGDPCDSQLSDQGGSENTLSASEGGAEGEEERGRGEGGSGDLAHRGRRVGPEKRAHHSHRVTKHKEKKKHLSKVGRPSRRKRGQPNVGQGEGEMRGWSDSSDSDVEGGRGRRDTDVKGVRRSRRHKKGNYLPHRKHSKAESGSPMPAKRQKKLRDSTATPLKRVPPVKNFLGELLTDIPEVDMCSLAAEPQPNTRKMSALQPHSLKLRPTAHTSTSPEISARKQKATPTMSIAPKTHSHSSHSHRPTPLPKHSANRTSREGEKERPKTRETGKKGSERAGRMSTTSSSKSCSPQDSVEKSPGASSKEFTLHARKIDVKQKQECKNKRRNSNTPVIKLQNKGESQSSAKQKIDRLVANKRATSKDLAQLSSHYKLLSTWEADYSRGSNSTRAPVLYAVDTIADKLAAIDGPWLEKAKLIWNHWKKIPPSEHEFYVEQAKKNRMEFQGKFKWEKHKIACAIPMQSSLQHNLLPSVGKPPVAAVSPGQTDDHTGIFTDAGTSVQCLVVSNATVLSEALDRDCVTSPAAGSTLSSPTSPTLETISIAPNTDPVALKEIKSEDLCSAVKMGIETLEQTLGSSPPAVPYSLRAVSLSPCSVCSPPIRSTASSPSREEPRPPHRPSQPSPPTVQGQRYAHKDSKSVTQMDTGISNSNSSIISNGICLPNPTELSSFCASSALISPLCPISPTCTVSSTPLVSSVVKQEPTALSTTASVLSLPLASLLPPNISMMLKDLPNSEQLQSISPQATSERRRLKSKKVAKSASVSPKQVRHKKSNSKAVCVPKGVSSGPGSIQKARRNTVPSGLTSSSAFLDTLAKVCLPNQPQFKALKVSQDPDTDLPKVAGSSSSSRQSLSPSSCASIEAHQQSPFTPLKSHLSSKSTSCVASPACSFSDQSGASTPSPLHPMANPVTQPVAMTTAHQSTDVAFSISTAMPIKCQSESNSSASQPASRIPDITVPSGFDVSNAPVSTTSLLHTSTIPPAPFVAIDQPAVSRTCAMNVPSCLPITPIASTLAATELGVNAKHWSNAGDTTTLLASFPSISPSVHTSTLAPMGTIAPAIDLGASLPNSGALNMYTGTAMLPTSSFLEHSASALAMSDPGLPTPRMQDMYTGGADSRFLQQTVSTASPSAMSNLGLNPPLSTASLATCAGNTTSSYQQQTLTTAFAPGPGLNVPTPSTQGMYPGGADSSFLQRTMTTASPSAIPNLGLSLPMPRIQDIVNSNAFPNFFTSPLAMSHLGLNPSKPRLQDVVSGIATPSFLTFTSASTVPDLGLSLPKPGVLDMHTGNAPVTTSSPSQPTASAPAVTVPRSGGAQDMWSGNATPNFLQQTVTTSSANLGSNRNPTALLGNRSGDATSSNLHQTLNVPKSGGEQGLSTGKPTPNFLQSLITTSASTNTTSSYLNQISTTVPAPANMSDLGLGLSAPSMQGMHTWSSDSSFPPRTMTTAFPFGMSTVGPGAPGYAKVPAPSLPHPTASTSASPELRLNVPKPGSQYMVTGDATPSFLQSAATSASAMPDLGYKPGSLDGKASSSLFQHAAFVPSIGLNVPKGLQDTHSGNAIPSILPTLTTGSSSAATGRTKKKHTRTVMSKAERLSKLGTTVNLPQGGMVPSFRIPVFHSDPFKPQTEHILPSLLASSTSSRGQSKSFGSIAVSKSASPPRGSETATCEASSKESELLQPPITLSGQVIPSKFSISNLSSANSKRHHQQQKQQQQQQKQQQQQQQQKQRQQQQQEQQHQQRQQRKQRLHPTATPTGSNPESGNIPLPLNFHSSFPIGISKTPHQQRTSANPVTSAVEWRDQSQSLPFQVANTSTISRDLGSNLRSNQEPSSSSSSTISSPFPSTTRPTSKHAVSGKDTSDGTKQTLYVAPPSLLREFPEIGVVTRLRPGALSASTVNAQCGKSHSGPYQSMKPSLYPGPANLPSFHSLGMPTALNRHHIESRSIDNGGTIQYYPLDTNTVNPAIPTSASSGDLQLGVGLPSFTPHSEPNSVLTTATRVLESPTTVTAMVTASSTHAPTLSSSTDEDLNDSPSIGTASAFSASVTPSVNSSTDWPVKMEMFRKLREHCASSEVKNRWNQHGKAGMEAKCEPKPDKQSSVEVVTAKDRKPSQTKKPRKRPSKGSLEGVFTPMSPPLSGDDRTLSEPPRPMVAAPEQLCNDLFLQGTLGLPPFTTPCSEEGEISPKLQVNPPIGDLSRWELERLYLYNLALLDQQRKYTKMLEKRLIMMEQEQRKKKPSKLDLYRQFLEFVVEPTRFPQAPAISFPEIKSEEIVLKGTFDKPILDEGLDVYSSYSKSMS